MSKSTTSQRGIGKFSSRSTNWAWMGLLLLFGAGAAHTQQAWYPDCGNYAQRPCESGDKFYDSVYFNKAGFPGAPNSFGNQQCDLALNVNPKLNECVGISGSQGGRRNILGVPASNSWINFAMKDQRFGIGADQAMNRITIFGTHNSYSNYQDGAFDALGLVNFNVDQWYSITDQLNAGARVIRLDPVIYGITTPDLENSDIEVRMCHQSADTSGATALECQNTSYGRLFASGVYEVQQWLDKNPGEVVVIRMYRVASNPDMWARVDNTLQRNTRSNILSPYWSLPSYANQPVWNAYLQGWPSLRQMRAMGKNLIIFSDEGTNLSYPWATTAAKTGVLDDGYTDYSGFNNCQNQGGVDVRQRGLNEWSYIAEDRSGSNFIDVIKNKGKPGTGLLDEASVKTATNCGFGIIGVDFLLAGEHAASLSSQSLASHVSVLGIDFSAFDYTFSNPDTRREATIWSWDENEWGEQGPAYLKTNGRWGSESDANSLAFACAVGQDEHTNSSYGVTLLNPINYQWVISPAAGPWSSGAQVCAALEGKFWAPQSALENQNLIAAVNAQRPGATVWLNHRLSNNLILEPTTAGLVAGSTPNSFVMNALQGRGYAAPNFQYTGGIGGALNALELDPPSVLGMTVEPVYKTISMPPDPNSAKLATGTYVRTFTISDTVGSEAVFQTFSITINVLPAPMVHITVDSNPQGRVVNVDSVDYRTPHVFDWKDGTTHAIDASHPDPTPGVRQVFGGWSGGQAARFTYYVTDKDATVSANFKVYYQLTESTLTNGRLDLSPTSADGFYLAGTPVNVTAHGATGYQLTAFTGALSGSTNPQSVTMTQPLSVGAIFSPNTVNVTVQARPANGVIYVDNYAYIGTTKFTWLVGATHTLDASKTEDGGGTHQVFSSWSIAGQPAKFTFTVPNGDTSITGNFNMSYLLTAIITGSGTMTESPSSVDGYYAAGTKVAITATPAAGYTFVGFAGALNGLANPQTLTMSGPLPVQAVFNPLAPNLTAQAQLTGGSGTVQSVRLRFSNTGTAVATGVQIGSASVAVVSGTGAVTVTTVLPLNFGNVAAGAVSAAQEMDLNWPTSATSAVLTINYTANGGAYQSNQRWSFSRPSGGTDN